MGKDKKNESIADSEDKVSYEEKLKYVSVIAKPMASKKLSKKVNEKMIVFKIHCTLCNCTFANWGENQRAWGKNFTELISN